MGTSYPADGNPELDKCQEVIRVTSCADPVESEYSGASSESVDH